MKKLVSLVALLNMLTVATMMVCASYAAIRANLLLSAPDTMTANASSFVVYDVNQNSDSQTRITVRAITQLLEQDSCALVFRGDQSYGIGLYDSLLQYQNRSLDGISTVFSGDIVVSGDKIILREGSFLQAFLDGSAHYAAPQGNMEIAGTYDETYPLDTVEYDYIYGFSESVDLDGQYSLDSTGDTLLNRILSVLMKNGYQVTMLQTPGTRALKNVLPALAADKLMPSMLLGLAMIYANGFFAYCTIFSSLQKHAAVHFIFGATRKKYFLMLAPSIGLSILLGTLAGCAAYALAFGGVMTSDPWVYLSALCLHLLISALFAFFAYGPMKFGRSLLSGVAT